MGFLTDAGGLHGRLETLLLDEFRVKCDLGDDDPTADEEFMTKLRVEVGNAKKSLTLRQATRVLLRYGAHKQQIEVTRAQFEETTADLVAPTMEITRRVLATACQKMPGLTVDRLLLVGGSARMPMIEAVLSADGLRPERTDYDL